MGRKMIPSCSICGLAPSAYDDLGWKYEDICNNCFDNSVCMYKKLSNMDTKMAEIKSNDSIDVVRYNTMDTLEVSIGDGNNQITLLDKDSKFLLLTLLECKLLDKFEDIPPEFANIINESFWDIV